VAFSDPGWVLAMTVAPKTRLLSLDVLRGATIAGMLLVNNAGDWGRTFAPLLHAEWNGWTPTDLVFPFFLFVLGVAIPLAFASRLEKSGGDLGPLYRQIARRTAILFALGLFLTWFPFLGIDWSRARIPGVLQRIALVYCCASLAYLHLKTRGRVWLAGGLLLGYWLVMTRVPVPGFGAGDLSPAGNLAGFVDQLILGAHVWRYAPGPADPEGILSTLPAVATALAGIFTGEWLRTERTRQEKVIGLFVSGSIAAAAGAVFGWFFPINKNLWTSSYVVLTAGLALLTLGVVFYFVDIRKRVTWAKPFVVFGVNSIAAYVLSGLIAKVLLKIRWTGAEGTRVSLNSWLYDHFFASWIPDYFASLTWALVHVLIVLAVMWWLYRRRIFIKI
jgi:predicted acyltransferase